MTNILDKVSLNNAFNLARKKAKEGLTHEAKQIYIDILVKFPKNKRAQIELTQLSKDRIKSEKNETYIASEQFNSLKEQYNAGEFDKALVVSESLLKKFPNSVELLNVTGIILKELRRFEQSKETLKKALQIDPNSAQTHYNIGSLLKEQDNHEEALVSYNTALKIKPKYTNALKNIGIILKQQGKLEESLTTYERILSFNSNDADVYNNMANVLHLLGKAEDAISIYKKAIYIEPNDANAHYNMGNVLKEQGRFEEAITACKASLAISPKNAEAYKILGAVAKKQGKPEDGINYYRKALSLQANDAGALNNLGNILKEQGKLEEALDSYAEVLTVEPENALALTNLSNLYTQVFATMKLDETLLKRLSNNSSASQKMPRFQIQEAVRAFIQNKQSLVTEHLNNYDNLCTNVIENLEPIEKTFCKAYSIYLRRLNEFDKNTELSAKCDDVFHLGESHCLRYAHHKINLAGSTHNVVPRIIFGVKAFHFSSKRGREFRALVKANFDKIPNGSRVFVSFGEIDCRANEGFIPAADKLNEPIETLIKSTVEGYFDWFTKQNEQKNHGLYFFNVPAPVYKNSLTKELNQKVASTVRKFNMALSEYSNLHRFKLIDVHGITLGKNGFSNEKYHIDGVHLGCEAIKAFEMQLA